MIGQFGEDKDKPTTIEKIWKSYKRSNFTITKKYTE